MKISGYMTDRSISAGRRVVKRFNIAKKIRILHLIPSLACGGAERQLTELLKHLNKSRYQLYVGCLEEGGVFEPEVLELGIPIVYFKRAFKLSMGPAIKIASWAKQNHIDIMHSWCATMGTYATVAGKLTGIKAVTSSARNSSPFRLPEYINTELSRFSDRQIAVSRAAMKKSFAIPPKNMHIVYNGVDLERFHPNSWKPIPPFRVAMIARLHPTKDHVTFLKAAQLVLRNRSDIEFLIIGEGETRPEIERIVGHHFKNGNIALLGRRNDIAEITRTLTVSVLLSPRKHGEGLSNSILESLASGVPVIATNAGGNIEAVRDGKTASSCLLWMWPK